MVIEYEQLENAGKTHITPYTMQLTQLNNQIKSWSLSAYPYTNVIGIARSMVALGTLLTLLVNDISVFMPVHANGDLVSPLLNPLAPINQYNFFLLLGFEHVVIAKWIAIILLAIVISGYYPRITCLFHWWISISFIYFSTAIDGGDHIAAVLTLLLLPLCLTDPRRNHWKTNHIKRNSPLNLFGLLSVYLIRIQIAGIYLHAATGKFASNEWMDGTSLYYWFNHSIFGMPAWIATLLNPVMSNSIGITAMTYSVIVLELMLFAAIGMSVSRRKKLLPFAIGFHFAIILVHGIFSFFFSIGAGLVLYLMDTSKNVSITREKQFSLPTSIHS
jgi:antimicrobial peptide system SdpB family protein